MLGMGLVASIVSPALAEPVQSLAQVVDTGGVQNKSVGDVLEMWQKWEILSLSVSMVLVIALLFAGGLLRPGGFAKAGLRDVSTLPAVVWVFASFVVILAMESAPQLLSKVQWIQDQAYGQVELQAINTVGMYLFGMIAGLGMLWILKASASDTDHKNTAGLGISILDVPVGLGCFMLAYPFIQLLNLLGAFIYTQTQSVAPTGMGHPTLELLVNEPSNYWVWAIVGGAIIGAPIVEELIFRVFLQGAMLKWLKSPWLSIIFSALAFAGVHRLSSDPQPWHTLLPIFALGLTCGVAYERTKRVGVPITMHVCFNLMNVLLALMIGADAAQTGV